MARSAIGMVAVALAFAAWAAWFGRREARREQRIREEWDRLQ